jgi:hypothetical protein
MGAQPGPARNVLPLRNAVPRPSDATLTDRIGYEHHRTPDGRYVPSTTPAGTPQRGPAIDGFRAGPSRYGYGIRPVLPQNMGGPPARLRPRPFGGP